MKKGFLLWVIGVFIFCFLSSCLATAARIDGRLYSELIGFPANRKIVEVDGVPCLKIFLQKGQSINHLCRFVRYFDSNFEFYRERIALINRLDFMAVEGGTDNLGTNVKFIYVPLNFSIRPKILPEQIEQISKLPKFILIDLDKQCLGLYQYGKLMRQFPISSGDHGTPARKFTILSKEKDHYSTLFDNAWMPYALRLFGNYYLHAGILPGYAASHGCVRLIYEDAISVFNWAEVGTPGEVIKGALKQEEGQTQVAKSQPARQLALPLKLAPTHSLGDPYGELFMSE